MEIVTIIVVGLVVGVLAKLLMPGPDPGGIVVTILVGIVGAMVAGGFGRFMGWYEPSQGAGLLASILGAMFLLWAYRIIVAGHRRRNHRRLYS
jgi:uncharacterized membrane protein YeaQ/YmgE (transglycosylase-associated protein family)